MSTKLTRSIISICALTAYRVYVTSTTSIKTAKQAYSLFALLTSLETLMGVINACLPCLRPSLHRIGQLLSSHSNNKFSSALSGSIPIILRLSRPLAAYFEKGSRVSEEGSRKTATVALEAEEGKWMKEGVGRVPKVERVIGMKVAEIHVRSDVDVESCLSEDRVPVGQDWECGKF